MPLLVSLILAFQAEVPLGPIVPAGANQSFYQAVLKVEDYLEKGDFEQADRALSMLPRAGFKLEWDDSKVPAGLRPHLASMRESAIDEWLIVVKDNKPKAVAEAGDLRISFADSLKDPAGSPVGATHTFNIEPGRPRLEAVIALNRGNPSQSTTAVEVRNEVVYAIAVYFGMERTPYPGAGSFRTDFSGSGQNRLSQVDIATVSRLGQLVERLTVPVKTKQRIRAARPRLVIEQQKLDLPKVLQAEPVKYTIKVSNPGNAPVSFRFTPDCGCLVAHHQPTLEAGQTAEVIGYVDSVNFVGELRHKFYIFANDAETPYRELPVNIDVEPLYRFVREGPSVLQMTEQGAETEVILVLAKDAKFTATETRLQGGKGTSVIEPWEGEVALAPGKPKVNGKGYRIRIRLDRSPIPGRALTNLEVVTDNPIFPLIRHAIYTQKGIIAVPESVYLGEVTQSPAIASFVLSRPGLPFTISKIEPSVPYLKATWQALPTEGEHRVTVAYDGKADFGPIGANLTVFTNDPKQPKVVVPVTGIVR